MADELNCFLQQLTVRVIGNQCQLTDQHTIHEMDSQTTRRWSGIVGHEIRKWIYRKEGKEDDRNDTDIWRTKRQSALNVFVAGLYSAHVYLDS